MLCAKAMAVAAADDEGAAEESGGAGAGSSQRDAPMGEALS
jgi:hypothetical protein